MGSYVVENSRWFWVLGRSIWIKILGISWVWVISDFSGICGVLNVGGFLIKIPGISGVFVFPGISNYVSGSLRGLSWFGLFNLIVIGSFGKTKISDIFKFLASFTSNLMRSDYAFSGRMVGSYGYLFRMIKVPKIHRGMVGTRYFMQYYII